MDFSDSVPTESDLQSDYCRVLVCKVYLLHEDLRVDRTRPGDRKERASYNHKPSVKNGRIHRKQRQIACGPTALFVVGCGTVDLLVLNALATERWHHSTKKSATKWW